MKKTNSIIITIIFLAIILSAGCQTSDTAKKTESDKPETNTTVDKTVSPKETAATDATDKSGKSDDDPTESSVSGSLATPTDAYKTAFEARQKKDVKALKKALSKDILEFFTEIGKEEKKTLDESLETLVNKEQAAKAEVRNEKIDGDQATLEYLDEKGNWRTMDFIKESDGWKLTIPANK